MKIQFIAKSISNFKPANFMHVRSGPHTLGQGISHTAVFVQVSLHRVFDMTTPQSLEAVAQVFRRIRMPQRVCELQKR